MFVYNEEIVQFNRDAINLPYEGDVQYLLLFPPTMRPSCVGCVMLKGTPEMFTDIYDIKPNR